MIGKAFCAVNYLTYGLSNPLEHLMVLSAIEGERADRLEAFRMHHVFVVILESEILPDDEARLTLH